MPVVFLHPPSLNRHPWVHRVFVFRSNPFCPETHRRRLSHNSGQIAALKVRPGYRGRPRSNPRWNPKDRDSSPQKVRHCRARGVTALRRL